jgi:hypothetical protein
VGTSAAIGAAKRLNPILNLDLAVIRRLVRLSAGGSCWSRTRRLIQAT